VLLRQSRSPDRRVADVPFGLRSGQGVDDVRGGRGCGARGGLEVPLDIWIASTVDHPTVPIIPHVSRSTRGLVAAIYCRHTSGYDEKAFRQPFSAENCNSEAPTLDTFKCYYVLAFKIT
jgi:hypothetical protein